MRGAARVLCTRLRLNPATSRPHTRLFSRVAASKPPASHRSIKSPTNALRHPPLIRPDSHNAAGQHFGCAPTHGRTTAHGPHRQLSTASNSAKKSARRRKQKLQIETSKPTEIHRRRANPSSCFGDELSEEQQTVLDLVLNQGKSVFFTGPAGTGKSFLLRKIIEGLTIKYLDDSHRCVAVTASTGLAAYSIGGTTLHRFAGIGIGKAPTVKLIMDIFKDPKLKRKRWMDVQVLIIDEISMIESTLFDELDMIARAVRGVDRPFGGIQLVITGDFFQLPPVIQGPDDGNPRFCFEAKAWKTAIQHTIGLTHVYRQRDPVFASMLNEIREGLLSPSTIAAFRRLSRPISSPADNGPEAADLFPLRREADVANAKRMQKVKGVVKTYLAKDGGIITDPATRKRLLSDCIAPEVLALKATAQVMLIKNIDTTLVNGSLGRVVGFANRHTFLHSRWDHEGHEENQESRPATAPSTPADHLPEERLPLYPVVRFQLANGGTRTELCEPAEWAVERWVPDPWSDGGWAVEKLATRAQVPLILAWALSIHKSQGQTLELVRVDLDRVFEMGQAYVALSRATSMDGLQVLNFDPNRMTAHPKVKAFYASLLRR